MAPVHLLALVHGMWGHPKHLAELERIIKETTEDATDHPLRVIVPETNAEDGTYDGIDWGGERVAEEITKEVARLKENGEEVVKFSITGYSLGGLISRYVIGILKQKGFFDDVKPMNFNTIATPHIGLLRYPSFVSSLFSTLGPKLLSRTGEQFYCVDEWSTTGRPLVEIMADPKLVFYQTLASFQRVCIYANAANDRTVPYMTAAFETEDPFTNHEQMEFTFDDKYGPVVTGYSDAPPQSTDSSRPSTPQPKGSKKWFRSRESLQDDKPRKSKKPFFPPFLQFRFPMNILFFCSLPLLVPTVLGMVIVRFTLATHRSRARIQLLEKDASNEGRLITALARLEKQVEDAVVDALQDAGNLEEPTMDVERGTGKCRKSRKHVDKEKPVFLPVQLRAAKNLNDLPNLQKVKAYFPDVHNAHAIIISRDVMRFDFHRRGEGLIRHWADGLVL